MALGKTLAHRVLNMTKLSTQTMTNCRISSSPMAVKFVMPKQTHEANIDPEPGDLGLFRRFFHRRAEFSAEALHIPIGKNLMEKLREMDVSRDRIRLDGLISPEKPPVVNEASSVMSELTVEEAKKLMRAAQIEMVKSKLREIESSWISNPEFVRICGEACWDTEEGSRIAKTLDESGTVLVLGNLVCLRPEQVMKSIEGLLPQPGLSTRNDPRRKELDELETKKAVMDEKAKALVRRELWAGLSFFIIQTAGFMRLTFWELSWDVMEPVCFYVTSMYFMAGYAFFLRTSIEPSFEGFYQSRFEAKQKKLMKINGFDVTRYNELKKAFYPKVSDSGHVHKTQFAAFAS